MRLHVFVQLHVMRRTISVLFLKLGTYSLRRLARLREARTVRRLASVHVLFTWPSFIVGLQSRHHRRACTMPVIPLSLSPHLKACHEQ